MTKTLIFKIVLTFFCSFSADTFSQSGAIFFSVTGDTVCYSSIFGQSVDCIRTSYTTYIISSDKSGLVRHKSFFQLVCSGPTNKCIEALPRDTVRKFHLELDGISTNTRTNKDFIVSVKPSNTHTVNVSTYGPKHIFQTTISIDISCKGQKLYSKTFDLEFKGESPKDFPEQDIVRISAWQKKNQKKYFVDISIKEHQTFKQPSDSEDSQFKNYQFIL